MKEENRVAWEIMRQQDDGEPIVGIFWGFVFMAIGAGFGSLVLYLMGWM